MKEDKKLVSKKKEKKGKAQNKLEEDFKKMKKDKKKLVSKKKEKKGTTKTQNKLKEY